MNYETILIAELQALNVTSVPVGFMPDLLCYMSRKYRIEYAELKAALGRCVESGQITYCSMTQRYYGWNQ